MKSLKQNQIWILSIIIFILIFSLTLYININSLKDNLKDEIVNNSVARAQIITEELREDILKNNYLIAKEKLNEIINKNKLFYSVDFAYNKFYFTNLAILKDYPDDLSNNYLIEDVTVDYLFGKISQKSHGVYEFLPSKDFNTNTNVIVKYQLYSKNLVENSLARINFSQFEMKKDISDFWISKYVDVNFDDITTSISYDNVFISKLTFKIDKSTLYKALEDEVKDTVLDFILFLLIIFVIYLVFYQIYFKVKILNPTKDFNEYIKAVLKNDFQKSLVNNEYISTYNDLASNLDKLSKKMASIVNELNINRDMVERKISTDDLTGLSNQKIFELELKGMFVASIKGYIAYLKLEMLENVSKDKGNNYIDTLVEDFAHTIQNSISHLGYAHVTLYRFYGSEFAIIAKRATKEEVEKLSIELLANLVENMGRRYNITSSITHIGFVSFDLYGNIDSVLNQAKESYSHAKTLGDNKYFIYSEENINKKVSLLENRTIEVVENDDFKIKMGNNTYYFDDNEKLFMQEVIPDIKDKEENVIPIGTFVSVAEKIGKAVDFDKLVILKALKYLQLDNITHNIAVNLSNETLKDQKFIAWLEREVYSQKEAKKHLVLSITSFSASLDFKLFKEFCSFIKDLGGKIILKRYNYTEIPLENLEGVDLDYIRIHKDYTTGINYDKRKRQVVKNIMIFGELNDIIILGDTVKAKDDYELLDRLGLEATSL